jgi:hypothetical protein
MATEAPGNLVVIAWCYLDEELKGYVERVDWKFNGTFIEVWIRFLPLFRIVDTRGDLTAYLRQEDYYGLC